MPVAAWLLSMVGGIVGRVLLSLGFSVVTVAGFEFAIGSLKSAVQGSMGSMPMDALNLIMLSGIGFGLNIIFGAISFRVALWSISRATRILGVGG